MKRRKNKTSRAQLDMVRDWDRRNPDKRREITKRWEQSPAGRAWLAANQVKKNAARKKWRARKRREALLATKKTKARPPGSSNDRDEQRARAEK